MKKGIIVLLIAVLVAGFAFADGVLTAGTLKGDATITFGVNFDEKEFGFVNSTAWKYNFKFEFDSTKVSVGEDHQTELWAELAAEATAYIQVKDGKTAEPAAAIKTSVKITKANIHVGEWTFGILNAGKAVDYAAHYAKNDSGDPILNVVSGGKELAPGFTVEYKGWRGGLGLQGEWTDDEFHVNVFAHGETKAFKFGANEEFSVQAGAYIHYYNYAYVLDAPKKNAGGAVKFAYTADKFSADAAADLQITRFDGENKFRFEADANATYKINDNGSAGLNIYAVEGQFVEAYYMDNQVKLDAKLWANYKFDFDGTELATEAYVDVRDILTAERTITVFAKETLTLGKVKLEFSEKWGYVSTKVFDPLTIEAYAFTLTAKATYTADKFETWASIDSLSFGKFVVENDSMSVLLLQASCGIKSTAIIENAEIGAKYKDFGFYKIFSEDHESVITKGAIEAYAKIAF